MVSLLIVAHSAQLAQGIKEFVDQVVGGTVQVVAAGGTADGGLGTNIERIQAGLSEVTSAEGTLVLVDIGGAVLAVETAIDMLGATNVLVSDAPLVEGAYLAVLEASAGASLEETAAAALQARNMIKVQQ